MAIDIYNTRNGKINSPLHNVRNAHGATMQHFTVIKCNTKIQHLSQIVLQTENHYYPYLHVRRRIHHVLLKKHDKMFCRFHPPSIRPLQVGMTTDNLCHRKLPAVRFPGVRPMGAFHLSSLNADQLRGSVQRP